MGAESFRVGDEGMFEGGEVRITSIEDNSEDGRQNVYFFTYLDEEGNSDGFTHTSGERKFLNQFSMFPRDWNAEEFGAESNFDALKQLKKRWREDFEHIGITYEEMLEGEINRLRNRMTMKGFDPNAKIGSPKYAEEFGAEVMMDYRCPYCNEDVGHHFEENIQELRWLEKSEIPESTVCIHCRKQVKLGEAEGFFGNSLYYDYGAEEFGAEECTHPFLSGNPEVELGEEDLLYAEVKCGQCGASGSGYAPLEWSEEMYDWNYLNTAEEFGAETQTFEARFNENGTIAYRYEPEWFGNQGGYPNWGAVFLGRLGGKDYYFVDGFIVQKIRGLKNEVLVQPIIGVRDLYLIDKSTNTQRQDVGHLLTKLLKKHDADTQYRRGAEEFGAEDVRPQRCLRRGCDTKTYNGKRCIPCSEYFSGGLKCRKPRCSGYVREAQVCDSCGDVEEMYGIDYTAEEFGAESDYTLKDWWQQSMDNCICGGNGCLYCEEINKDYDENIALSDLRKISKIVGTDCHCDKTYEDDVLQCYNCQTAMTLEKYGAEEFGATKGMDTYAQPFSELKIKPTKTKVGILLTTIVAGGLWYSKKMKEE